MGIHEGMTLLHLIAFVCPTFVLRKSTGAPLESVDGGTRDFEGNRDVAKDTASLSLCPPPIRLKEKIFVGPCCRPSGRKEMKPKLLGVPRRFGNFGDGYANDRGCRFSRDD